jgi:hypothetical protein
LLLLVVVVTTRAADMMRRMQRQDVEDKKEQVKAAIKAAADSESKNKMQIDPEELERIRRRQAGVQVTVESFLAWKKQFDAEMAARHTKTDNNDENKITGKQLFLQQQASGGILEAEEELCLEGESEEIVETDELPPADDFNDDSDSDYVPEEGEEEEEEEVDNGDVGADDL